MYKFDNGRISIHEFDQPIAMKLHKEGFMKIALYDDCPKQMDKIQTLLFDYSFSREKEFEIQRLSSAKELLDKAINADLLFLDVMLEDNLNGIEIAKEMRIKGYSNKIVLITSSLNFAVAGYKIDAFRFVVKPVNEAEFMEVMDDVFSDQENNPEIVTVSFNEVEHILDARKIIMIESSQRQRIIHTLNKQVTTSEPINSLLKRLPSDYFAMPHQSFIVNLNFIDSYTAKKLILSTGDVIIITRVYNKSFSLALHRFTLRQGGVRNGIV